MRTKINVLSWPRAGTEGKVSLELRRVILFTSNLDVMTAFYRDVVGLPVAGQEEGWVDFSAGACGLALHAGASSVGRRAPKIVFYASDVAQARLELVRRGLTRAGDVKAGRIFDMCEGRDPDGNRFQISSRG